MASIASPDSLPRTTPTKAAMPPTRRASVPSFLSSALASKSSRCTRIIALASRDRREQSDLVARGDAPFETGVLPVDGDAHRAQVAKRRGVARRALLEPLDERAHGGDPGRRRDLFGRAAPPSAQRGEIEQLHHASSLKGRKSTIAPFSSI